MNPENSADDDGSAKDAGPLFLATLNDFKGRVDVMENFVQEWTGGMRDHVAVLDDIFCQKLYPSFRDEVSRLKGIVREKEKTLASSRKDWMQSYDHVSSEVAVLREEKAQLSENLLQLENDSKHRQQQADVTLEHVKAEAAAEKKELALRHESTQKTVERLLKAYRGLDAKKMDVEQKYSKLLRESASANGNSSDEAAGQPETKKARKLVTDIQEGEAHGWACKQEGPSRAKKLKQLQIREEVWRREVTFQSTNEVASSHATAEFARGQLAGEPALDGSGGREVEPPTVQGEQVGACQGQGTFKSSSLKDRDNFKLPAQKGPEIVTSSRKVGVGEGKENSGNVHSSGLDRKLSDGILGGVRTGVRAGKSGEAGMDGFRTCKAKIPAQLQQSGSRDREDPGIGGGACFSQPRRRKGAGPSPKALNQPKKPKEPKEPKEPIEPRDRPARASAPGQPEKSVKWLSTRSMTSAECDTHEDFLLTPQQKVLSALADEQEGGEEGGNPAQERRGGESGEEEWGAGVGKPSDGSGRQSAGEGGRDSLNETSLQQKCLESEWGVTTAAAAAAGCSQEYSERGRVAREHASGAARRKSSPCIPKESSESDVPHSGESPPTSAQGRVGVGGGLRGPATAPDPAPGPLHPGQKRHSQDLRPAGQKGGPSAAPPAYKYNASVRKRADREQLVGVECKQCEQFYRAVEAQDRDGIAENRCEHFYEVSKHRYYFPPPATPEGFWNLGFDTDGQDDERLL